MAQYFLAVDAGGTKTIGAIANGERELARVEAGTIKLSRTGKEEARRNLEALFTRLAQSQGIDLSSITRICIGASGVSVPHIAAWIRDAVQRLAGRELLLCGDEEIALDAAFPGAPGILAVAGTGSNAVGRAGTGELVRAGGWGPALGDEGSGHWIGQQALARALRARDEGFLPPTLLEAVLRFWQLAGIEDLVEKTNAAPAPDFSQLAPLVASCAERGDAVAGEVLDRAGEELAQLTLLVLHRLREFGPMPSPIPSPPVAFTGGVLENIGLVRQAWTRALRREEPEIEILSQPVDPIAGALWRARNGVHGSYQKTNFAAS